MKRGEKIDAFNAFVAWRNDVDCDHLLDVFDLALGWFSGKNFSHDEALQFAEWARDHKWEPQ